MPADQESYNSGFQLPGWVIILLVVAFMGLVALIVIGGIIGDFTKMLGIHNLLISTMPKSKY